MSDFQTGFSDLGISSQILAVLERLHFKTPTPIQHQSIPVVLAGKDIIGIAQTGTGKTLAFGIPLIQRLQAVQGRGLVLIPTRELALQVEEAIQKIGRSFGTTMAVLIGGESMVRQTMALRQRPRILVATPGRLLDHLQRKNVTLEDIRILVLDEADRMLDMGFAPQIKQILKSVSRDRQTLLYSATMPSAIVEIAKSHMRMPVRVEMDPSGTAAENVEQEIILIDKELKHALLETILQEHAGTALVFSRTKHGARKICHKLTQRGYGAAEIHANRSQGQRREAMEGFRRGKYRILVATDIASRGIDVTNIGIVINYDLPDNSEDYVHRIGRTGRAGREGKAISFATPDQRGNIRDIERLIRKTLKVVSKRPPSLSASSRPPAPQTASVQALQRPHGPQGHKKPHAHQAQKRHPTQHPTHPRQQKPQPKRPFQFGNQPRRREEVPMFLGKRLRSF